MRAVYATMVTIDVDHRDRIAMRDDEGASGKTVASGTELFQVLRRLQHPALAAAQQLQHLQHRLQVAVVRRLVVREVVVAPRRASA